MIRLYVAVSLDGYIADAEGGVAWLDGYMTPEAAARYKEFAEQVGTAVMGRTTYDQALTFGDWQYGAMRCYVLTSSEILDPPEGVEAVAREDLRDLVDQLRDTELDTWLMGGGKTVQAFLEIGAIDEYEIYVIPVLLGDGLSLFPRGSKVDHLQLVETQEYTDGMVMLRYRPRNATRGGN